MSLVGTRPPTVDEWDKYELHHRARLATKPGLTGMWQVSGRSNITDFEEVVKLDKQYISEWTMGLDIKILFKTVHLLSHILVEPNVKSANKTEKIEKKVKKVNENGNDSKYYSAGTAELNYTLVTSPNIVFECNLINPETIDNYIESYKEEVSDIKYGEDISGEKIYDNMVKINDLVKTQLF